MVKRTEQSKQRIWGDLLQTRRTDQRTQRLKATSETQNQAVPNTDAASTSAAAAAGPLRHVSRDEHARRRDREIYKG